MEVVTVDGVQYMEFTIRPKDSDLHVKTYIYNFWEKSLQDIPANYNYKPSFKEWMLRQRLQYSLPRGPNGTMIVYSELGRPLRPSDFERTDLAVLEMCEGKEKDMDFDPESWDVDEDDEVYHVDKTARYNSFLDIYDHPIGSTKIVYRVPEMDDTQTQTRPF